MQVRVCPKCKAQNRPTSAACSNCYASLESVPVTEGTAPPVATSAAPRAPRAAAPTRQTRPPHQAGVPGQTQMGTPVAPPPGMPMPPGAQMPPGAYQMAPPPKKSPAGLILLIVFVAALAIGGMMFVAMKSGLLRPEPRPTEDPAKVTIAFLEAKRSEDLAKCEPYLSSRSIKIIKNTLSSPQARSAGFTEKDAAEWMLFGVSPTAKEMAGKQIAASEVIGDEEADNRTVVVHVVIDAKDEPAPASKPLLPPGATPPPEPAEPEGKVSLEDLFDMGPVDMHFVLVAEEGHWKVDLEETDRRAEGEPKAKRPFKLGK